VLLGPLRGISGRTGLPPAAPAAPRGHSQEF